MPPRSQRAALAMANLAEKDPALASLALWCDVHDTLGETRTSGQTILIGESFAALPLREQIGILGHHILHVALRHTDRMDGLRQRLGTSFTDLTYNLATDALVNEIIVGAGHALPRPAVTLTTLLNEVLQQTTDQALGRWDAERLYFALASLDGAGGSRRETYTGKTAFKIDLESGGNARDSHESASNKQASHKQAVQAQDRNRKQQHKAAHDAAAQWQARITQALQVPGAAGRGIGAVLARVRDLPRVQTPWEIHLRRLLAKAMAEAPRLTYRRPRTGWIAAEAEARLIRGPTPVFEPALARHHPLARIVVGLDSSGSVSDAVLALFAAEVAGIARRSGAETHLLCFDETVYDHTVLKNGHYENALTAAQLQRQGGTSFIDVMDAARKIDPSIVVILTDLDGPFGPPPPFAVVWATPQETWPAPPFGKVVSLAR